MPIRKILILLFVVFNAHGLFAQDTIVRKRFIEYYVGGNRSDRSSDYKFEKDKVVPEYGLNAGLYYGRNFTKHFGIGTGLGLSQFNYTTQRKSYGMNNKFSYLFGSLPLYLKFNLSFGSKFSIECKSGFNFYLCPIYSINHSDYQIGLLNPKQPYQAKGVTYGPVPAEGEFYREFLGFFVAPDLKYKITSTKSLVLSSQFKSYDIDLVHNWHRLHQYQASVTIGLVKQFSSLRIITLEEKKRKERLRNKPPYSFGVDVSANDSLSIKKNKQKIYKDSSLYIVKNNKQDTTSHKKKYIGSQSLSFEPVGFTILGFVYETIQKNHDNWYCIRFGLGVLPIEGVNVTPSISFSVLVGSRRTKLEVGLGAGAILPMKYAFVGMNIGARTFLKNGFFLRYNIIPYLDNDSEASVLPGFSIGKIF